MIRPVVPVIAFNGDRSILVYAMYDTAATAPAGLLEVADAIGAELTSEPCNLAKFNSYHREVCDFASFKISSLDGTTVLDVKDAIIGTILTTERDSPPKNSDIEHLDYMCDVHFDELHDAKIGIILDASFSWAFGPFERRGKCESMPVAWLTSFGWTLIGRSDRLTDQSDREVDICLLEINEMTIQDQIHTMIRHDFVMSENQWAPSEEVHLSKEDQNSLKIMEDSIKVNESSGHFSVALPWVKGREKAAEILSGIDSYSSARARLMKEKRRLELDPVRKAGVFAQFKKTKDKGHSSEVDPNESLEGRVVWYMPTHIVPPFPDKPDKWRVCLDAASKVQGESLNGHLGGGPDGLNSLVGIYLRWRENRVVLTGDITDYFHMVEVNDDDISAFRYLWFKDESMEEVIECQSNVQIFGARSSPSIAAFTLKYHASRIREKYGDEVFYQLVWQMYVDDLITSFKSVEIARDMRKKLVAAMAEGGFTLCKLNSNFPQVLIDDPSSLPSQADDGVHATASPASGSEDVAEELKAGKMEVDVSNRVANAAIDDAGHQEDADAGKNDIGRHEDAGAVQDDAGGRKDADAVIDDAGGQRDAGAGDEFGSKQDSDFEDTCPLIDLDREDDKKTSMKDLIEGTFHNENFIEATKMFIQPQTTTGKILGVGYCHKTDKIFIRGTERAKKVVKNLRDMLKLMASIFDPLGHAAPFILKARIEFQKIIALGYDWDDELPVELLHNFLEWKDSIAALASISIPRWTNDLAYLDAKTQLICFSDASKKDGYGMVAYLRRAIDENSIALVRQVFGKARVIPLNFHERKLPLQEENPSESVPKLELEAARLASFVQDMLNRESRETYDQTIMFTDSHTVLQWLLSYRKKFKTYEFHRINKIRDLTDVEVQWNYVASAENPADLASHGFLGSDTDSWSFWFSGPKWLAGPERDWPPHRPLDVLPAKKTIDIAAISASATFSPLDLLATSVRKRLQDPTPFDETTPAAKLRLASRHGSWPMKVRSIARYRRKYRQLLVFLKHKKYGITLTKAEFDVEIIDTEEFQNAEDDLIRCIQFQHYAKEIKSLLKLGVTSPDSHSELRCKTTLVSLNPFLDDNIALRAGGRIRNCVTLSYEAQFPRILPGYDENVRSLIRYTHQKLIHADINHTFHTLRSRFHFVGGRNSVNNALRVCVPCQRLEKRPMPQKMGVLPSERVNYVRPFQSTACDVMGPYLVKQTGSRADHKRWVLMCCCMTTRAVWLFPLRDMTTGVLINALTKLINLYPGVETIFSDCGTNFTGAKNENERVINEWNNSSIQAEMVVEGVTWKTTPPHAHFAGGVYERMIRSAKKHLRHLFNLETLDIEVFETSLSRVSAVLNGRPLTYASNSVDDFRILTPNSFLYPHIITPAWATIAPPIPASGDDLRGCWRETRRLVDAFEKAWFEDYLKTLNPYAKWRHSQPNFYKGQLIILVDKNVPRHQWRIGRVDSILSEGSHIHRVIVSTANHKQYERHVNTLIPLEIDQEA